MRRKLRFNVWTLLVLGAAISATESAGVRSLKETETSDDANAPTFAGDMVHQDPGMIDGSNIPQECEESWNLSQNPLQFISAPSSCCMDICGQNCGAEDMCYISRSQCVCREKESHKVGHALLIVLSVLAANTLLGFVLTLASVIYFESVQQRFSPSLHKMTPLIVNKWFLISLALGLLGWFAMLLFVQRLIRTAFHEDEENKAYLPTFDMDPEIISEHEAQLPPPPRRHSASLVLF